MLENFGITNLWTYLIGVIFITLVPGPNSLFVLTSSAKYGVKNGYKAALGVLLVMHCSFFYHSQVSRL